jgi:pentatricopeptide repeat protein
VINCWAKSGRSDAPEAALKRLRNIQQQHLAADKSARPITINYTAVINAFAQTGQVKHAEALLEEM